MLARKPFLILTGVMLTLTKVMGENLREALYMCRYGSRTRMELSYESMTLEV
jgi:hypothetical protein